MTNYKIMLIALALCLCCVMPAMAAHDYYDGSNPNKVVPSTYKIDPTGIGELTVRLACGHNVLSKTIEISHILPANLTFKSGERIPEDLISTIELYGEPAQFKLLDNGMWRDTIVPGWYLVELIEGTGNKPEWAVVEVTEDRPSGVDFIGQAFSTMSGEVCKITILEAQYGIVGENCERVLISPEHTEYRVRGHWDQVCHWEHGHQVCHNEWDHSSQWGAWSDNPYEHWSDIPGNDKQTRTVAAVYHTVCTGYGTYADVKQEVQSAIDGGYTSFLFNNAQNPGGIFDITTIHLLVAIQDPAPGHVKSVNIDYTSRCSSEVKHIDAQEYEIINLI